jgi:ubiquinone/menaquinone biosynthesis C-methylase UbiE
MGGLFGKGVDRMPDWAFRTMALFFRLRDALLAVDRRLEAFDIKPGQTVVDYGCGPGSYLRRASELVGPAGRVLAVDIHELAILSANRRIRRHDLANVSAHLTAGGSCPLADGVADVVYALDMFHMVADTDGFLKELRRITKPDGVLFLEDGHQARKISKAKLAAAHCWQIIAEDKRGLKCRPLTP